MRIEKNEEKCGEMMDVIMKNAFAADDAIELIQFRALFILCDVV